MASTTLRPELVCTPAGRVSPGAVTRPAALAAPARFTCLPAVLSVSAEVTASPPAYLVMPVVLRVITPELPVCSSESAAGQLAYLSLFIHQWRLGLVPPWFWMS